MVTLSNNQLVAIFPHTSHDIINQYVNPLNKTLDVFGFNDLVSTRCFIAQAGHESGGLNLVQENLNYSAQGLVGVFGKYFNASSAAAYARQPEKIANKVYANRMGNGDESSGDGYRFRGRGLIQITGKSNYQVLSTYFNKSLDDTVAYLSTPEGAAMSAGWFFSANKLISIAVKGDMTTLTKRINGGLNGLDDRMAIYHLAEKLV